MSHNLDRSKTILSESEALLSLHESYIYRLEKFISTCSAQYMLGKNIEIGLPDVVMDRLVDHVSYMTKMTPLFEMNIQTATQLRDFFEEDVLNSIEQLIHL